MSINKFGIISCLICATLSSSIAMGQGLATSNVDTNATVNQTCSVSANDINFGNLLITKSTTPTNIPLNIVYICNVGIQALLTIDKGSSPSYSQRTMLGNTPGNLDKLNYNIYLSSGGNSIYGNNTGGTVMVSLISDGKPKTRTLYTRLIANQFVTPDNYKDTLTINLNY